jgi:hypothetical protein
MLYGRLSLLEVFASIAQARLTPRVITSAHVLLKENGSV